MAVTQATRLGCGRDIDEVWATVGAPPSAHERTCPYCRTARANLADLAAATAELTVADRADPHLRISPGSLADILTIARSEVRRGRTIPLRRPSPPSGDPSGHRADETILDLTVSELAIATVLRRASDQIPGVEAGRCSIALSDPQPRDSRRIVPTSPVGDPSELPVDVTIEMEVSISHTTPFEVLSQLRRQIVQTVTAQVGVTVSRIDIHVRDVLDA